MPKNLYNRDTLNSHKIQGKMQRCFQPGQDKYHHNDHSINYLKIEPFAPTFKVNNNTLNLLTFMCLMASVTTVYTQATNNFQCDLHESESQSLSHQNKSLNIFGQCNINEGLSSKIVANSNPMRKEITSYLNKLKEHIIDDQGMPSPIKDTSSWHKILSEKPNFMHLSPKEVMTLYDSQSPQSLGAGGSNEVYKVYKDGKPLALRIEHGYPTYPQHVEPHLISSILDDLNITHYHPRITGVYNGPCIPQIGYYYCRAHPKLKLLYTEIEYIDAQNDASEIEIYQDNMIFEELWNNYCVEKYGKFSVGDAKDRHFLVSKTEIDRAYHVINDKNEEIYLFKAKEFPYLITRVDLDAYYPIKKILQSDKFGFNSEGMYKRAETIQGKNAMSKLNTYEKIHFVKFISEYFESYKVSISDIPSENVKHFYLPENSGDIVEISGNTAIEESPL